MPISHGRGIVTRWVHAQDILYKRRKCYHGWARIYTLHMDKNYMDWGEWQKEIIIWGGKREEGGKWEERLRPWRLDEEDCGGVFQQQGGVWGMKQDTGPNAGTPAWNKYQDHMYCSVGGFGMFWHMMKHLKVTSCCAEYDIMLCLNMFQVEHDQQKSLMELSLQQKSLTLQYKRRAFPPQSNFSTLSQRSLSWSTS